MSTNVQKERLRSLISRRDKWLERMQYLYEYTTNLTAANKIAFMARFERIDEYFSTFDKIQDDIDTLCAAMDPADKEDTSEVTRQFEDYYYDTKAFVRNNKLVEPPSATPTPSPSAMVVPAPGVVHARLPKLEVPVFSGDLTEWSNFISLFKSTIHRRTDISEVEKLQYLRSFLRGSPLHLIENYQLTDDNYHTAFKTLTDRYENKRYLSAHYLNMILNFKPLPNSNVSGLRTFLETFQTNVAAVKNLGLPNLGDFLLVQIALRALNVEHKKMFEDKLEANEVPTYDQLIAFVNKLCVDSEMVQFSTCPSSSRSPAYILNPPRNNFRKPQPKVTPHFQPSSNASYLATTPPQFHGNTCALCHSETHPLFKCSAFLKMDVSKRVEVLKSQNRCFNCLGTHRISECRSNSACQTCRKRHHSLIHRDSNFPRSAPSDNPSTSATTHTCNFSTGANSQPSTVLLGTACATILDTAGIPHPIRLVVDPGSQISLITESCVQRIGLKKYPTATSVSGVGDNKVPENNGAVTCTIRSRQHPNVALHTEAVVLKRISSNLPSMTVAPQVLAKFAHLDLADPSFDQPSSVDFLLGAELYGQILCASGNNVIHGTPSSLRTVLGWIIFGRTPTVNETNSQQSLFITAPSLDTTLQKFWETEEVAVPQLEDPEDIRCEEHFVKTHSRDKNGRYMVSLPFREDPSKLGENHTRALTQYINLEKRLNKNETLQAEYNTFFADYATQGHMEVCKIPSPYVIPHHAVIKESSSTTKVRAVFNASAASSNQKSLNDLLMKGPKLQKDICSIILSFRCHRIVVCADIRQMYRQVLVHPDDRKFQHIFWRNPQTQEISEYELKTITYGISPSAYQAQRVLQQLVIDEGHAYPLASKAILQETYIDDVVSGQPTLEAARQLQQELVDLLAKGCFELRKWASNNEALLEGVPHDHREKSLALRENEEPTFKILGLHWNPASDNFFYHVSDIDLVFTKRSILSHVARMFDPLGWLSPVIFWAKYLLQQLWLSQHSWDDPLDSTLAKSWADFSSQLSELEHLRIPRFVDTSAPHDVHVVGFCDASQKGYAAAMYIVTSAPDRTENTVYLLKAKSKVAPTKSPLSIPRLELCGAQLLARLYDSLKTYLSSLKVASITFYSDSNIVLAWIRTPPHTLKTYVGNRIAEINRLVSHDCVWYHVPGEENPADCASRGLLPLQFLDHTQWLRGPDFLRQPKDCWYQTQGNGVESLPELKDTKQALLAVTPAEKSYLLKRSEKYSKLQKVQRVFAHILRFISNVRTAKSQRVIGPLQVSELDNSLLVLIKLEQQYHFSNVITALESDGKITNSAILKLTPFLDEHGRLRVGGRLRNAQNLSQDSIHPLLLSKQSHLAELLCDHYHITSLHAGPRTVQALIQQKYWIISLRNLLRYRIFKCLRCYRFASKPVQPIMSDLPERRVTQERPFLHVGVDFGGPFYLKECNRRKSHHYKAYLCLFVCFTTKALHLELVTELTAAAFLACLDRFISRRGLPHTITSDNGTNFVAAARELKEVYSALQDQSEEISNVLAARHIRWIFNCPTASNQGGLFESGIKSAKHHLRRVIGEQVLTYEEFTTLLCRVEAVLNSRPLTDVSHDPLDGLDYLSPAHFLIGSSLLSPPELDYTAIPLNRLSRWRLLQQAAQSFWKVWSTSYLQSLTPRSKWFRQKPPIKSGDLVLLPKANTLPLHWPLGRVTEVFPGSDNVTRVCKIKLQDATLTRPVNKIIPLNFSV